MQPEKDNAENWQQPTQQPANSPYTAPVDESVAPQQPVVTMQPDATAPAAFAEPVSTNTTAEANATQTDNATLADDSLEAQPVRWQAKEYIDREKNALWFVGFAVITIGFMILAVFLMKSWTFAILIPVMAATLLVFTQRPPRVLDYTLGRKGLHINDHLYSFSDFKAFAVIHGDDEHSISLIPVKRFKPAVSIYFPEEVGEAIVDLLATRLPMQELHLDFIDRMTRKLRL